MNIYPQFPSTEVRPYVYYCEHKETGQFYYGYRCANTVPSSEDFGINYKTSSKKIIPIFDQFNWFIVAEFHNADDAYTFEQSLIYENWDNPLILNQHFNINGGNFRSVKGTGKGVKHHRRKGKPGPKGTGKNAKGHSKTPEQNLLNSLSQKGIPKPKPIGFGDTISKLLKGIPKNRSSVELGMKTKREKMKKYDVYYNSNLIEHNMNLKDFALAYNFKYVNVYNAVLKKNSYKKYIFVPFGL